MIHAFCKVSIAPVRAEGKDQAEIVTQLLFGELVFINEVNEPWTKITTFSDNYSGYIDHKHVEQISEEEFKNHIKNSSYLINREAEIITEEGTQRVCRGSFFPVSKKEFHIGTHAFQKNTILPEIDHSILSLSNDYLNTPYLWGGRSPFGIDCSGITQVIYSINGIQLPRDASQQVQLGSTISFEKIAPGDLAFFENKKGKITHVGILDGQGNIIHASGHVRKDPFSKEGILHSKTKELTHKLSCIKRLY